MIATKNMGFAIPKKRTVVNDLPVFKRNTEGSGFVPPIRKPNIGIGIPVKNTGFVPSVIPRMTLNKPQVAMQSMGRQISMPAIADKPTFNLPRTGLVPKPKAAQLPGYRRGIGLPNKSDNTAADLLKRMKNKVATGGMLDNQELSFIQQLAKTAGIRR